MPDDKIQDIPIACSLSAQEMRSRQGENENLLRDIAEVKELENGYALKFTSDAERLQGLLQFIIQERACCPFFTFELRFEPQNGPIWLSLSGPDGTKDFMHEMFGVSQ